MKNILAENLLRFGVKNLSDDIKRKLQEQDEGGGAGAQLQNLGLSIDQGNLDLADSEGYLRLGAYTKAFKLYAGPGGSNLIGKNLYLLKSFDVIPQTKSQQAGAATQRLSPVLGVRAQNISSLPIKSLWTSRVSGTSYAGAIRVYFTTYSPSFSKSQLASNLELWKKKNPNEPKISGVDVKNLIINPDSIIDGGQVVKSIGIGLSIKQNENYEANIETLMKYLMPTNAENSYFVNTVDTLNPQQNQNDSRDLTNQNHFLTVYQLKMSPDAKSQAIMGYIPQIWDPTTLDAGETYGVQIN